SSRSAAAAPSRWRGTPRRSAVSRRPASRCAPTAARRSPETATAGRPASRSRSCAPEPSGPMTVTQPTVDHALVRELKNREDARFGQEHPRSAELWQRGRELMPNGVPMAWFRGSYHHLPMWVEQGHGARFTDVDGHTYSEFNL